MTNGIEFEELIEKVQVLESRISFQDDTIETLNQVIYEQQKQIAALELRTTAIIDKMTDAMADHSGDVVSQIAADEKPPHY